MERIHIYILNLKRSPHRKKYMQQQLKSVGVAFKFIESVDGKGMNSFDFFEYDKGTLNKTGKELKSTEVGVFKSHINALKQAQQDGVDWAIVLEDDVVVSPMFFEMVKNLKSNNEYDLIRLYTRNQRKCELSDEIFISPRKNYNNWGGALGYAINQNGIHKILETYAPIYLKIDLFLFGNWMHKLKIAYTNLNLVSVNDDIASDIGYNAQIQTKKNCILRVKYDVSYKLQRLIMNLLKLFNG